LAKSSNPQESERPGFSTLPSADPDAPPSLADSTKVVAWGIVFWGGVQLVASIFQTKALATLVVQAALAEWGAGRMGIAWTRWKEGGRANGNLPRRLATGAASGAAFAAAAVILSLAVHSAVRSPATPSPGILFLGLATSALAAVRDELLLRGVVLRATRGLLPVWASLLAAGATAAMTAFGASSISGALFLGEGLRGVALAGIWMCDRGAWMACAANAAWMWGFGAATRGGLFDVRFATEPESTPATLGVLAVAAVAASWAAYRSGSVRSLASPGGAD
jgi:hypothetical protein